MFLFKYLLIIKFKNACLLDLLIMSVLFLHHQYRTIIIRLWDWLSRFTFKCFNSTFLLTKWLLYQTTITTRHLNLRLNEINLCHHLYFINLENVSFLNLFKFVNLYLNQLNFNHVMSPLKLTHLLNFVKLKHSLRFVLNRCQRFKQSFINS